MQLRRLVIWTAFALVWANSAQAAPRSDWAGWYAGANAGGNAGTSDTPTSAEVGACFTCFAASFVSDINATGNQGFNTKGFTGGIQGGYNWQAGSLVTGVEADFNYFRSAGSTTVTAPDVNWNPFFNMTVSSSLSTDWLMTVRPRLGVAAGNWLFYGTAGLAVTRLKADWSFRHSQNAATREYASASAVKAGWVIGGGIEAALPGNFSLGVEYLYVKFNGISLTDTNMFFNNANPTSGQVFHHSASLATNIVRVRLNRQF